MTMLAHSTAQHETPGVIDFAPDMLVIPNIDVLDPKNDRHVSRFGEESWLPLSGGPQADGPHHGPFRQLSSAVPRFVEAVGVLRGESQHAHG